jgi:hypothetical protein
MIMLSEAGTAAVQWTSDPLPAGVATAVGVGRVPLLGEPEAPAVALALADAVAAAVGVT